MKKNVLKKLLAMLLVFAMSAPVIGYLGTNAGEVQAAEEEKTVGYVIVPSTAVDITEPTDETQPKLMSVKIDDATYGQYADYIFAGWYTDEAATVAAATGTTGAYARFVPSDVLSTKVQVTNGIVTNTTNSAYKDKYVMRFVSSVDSTDYKYAGFELSYGNNILESKTYKVFKRIDSTTGVANDSVDTYDFSPKVVNTKSEYFITGKYPVAEADKAVNYTIRAYWVTKDGTKVYGRERCVSVEDGIDNNRLNLTVDGELNIGGQYSAAYTDKNGKSVTIANSNVEVLTSGNGYSNIRLKSASKDTKSVTAITIKNGNNTIAEGLYRNLYTKYTGTADTTWYDMYSATDYEFIIASSADLYGLAAITKKTDYDFEGDKIYVVSDIDANPEKLELLENENYLKWYTYDTDNQKVYQAKPSYSWTPIGTSSNKFNGVFDGQMHIISGVYLNTSSQYGGLFAVTGADANICNLKLKNSYFKTSANNIGSIVGQAQGTFSKVYSDAIVKSSKLNMGGLIGSVATNSFVDMDECWYAGNVSVTNSIGDERQIGGLIGFILASNSSVPTSITNCLNSGTIDATSEKNNSVAAGGLVGRDYSQKVAISNSLNVGLVTQSDSTTKYYGPIIGESKGKSLSMPRTYATTECSSSVEVSGLDPVSFTTVDQAIIVDWDADTLLTNLEKEWTTVAHGIPVLTAFEKEVFDTSWYDEDKSVYVLKDKGDLYGMAKLSENTSFEGKTIKLANDIIVNTGNAEDWEQETKMPFYTWTPIGSSKSFNGVFDGDMHTISGIYLDTTAAQSGLFSQSNAKADIHELKLCNSYFKTSANNIGSIVGQAKGTFSKIYSDAIVQSSALNVGGLIGRVASNSFVDMDECWYAGKVSVTDSKPDTRQIGGLIGFILASNSTTPTSITNCLNTGTIDATSEKNNSVAAGGLVGRDYSQKVEISNSLNAGLVAQSSSTTKYYGPIIGESKVASLTMSNTYATTDSSRSTAYSGFTSVPFESVDESTVIGWDAATISSNLGDAWIKADYRTPVLKAFKNESDGRIDVSWFDEASYDNTSEYTLYDEEDLYGFTWICKDYNFSGKTVKLGADIVVNEGTASANWASKSNYRQWWPIGLKKSNSLNIFQGTFNGKGHTISGLYLDFVKSGQFDGRYAGLFAGVGESGTVENLRLTESYFQSNARDFGGVAGVGKGKFYNIYNSVIMNAYAYVVQNTDDTITEILNTATCGGFIGMTSSAVVLDKCWFAGEVTNNYNSTSHQGTGGLIGYASAGTVTMTNCMNSGTVKMDTQTANATARLGGFIGYMNKEIPITMNACLNTGSVTASTTATNGYGPLVGYCYSRDLVSVSATYVLDSTDIPKDDPTVEYPQYTVNKLAPTTTYGVVTESDMKTNAATIMPLLDWNDEWKAVSDAMPELNFDYTTSVNGQKFVATSEDQETLANLYAGRTLLQGDMHAHAQTYGRGAGAALGDDGTVPLATWKEQLEALDLDFAASLDHDQNDHINHDDWDTGMFVYGTELRAVITDLKDQTLDGKLHFDMIFKTREQFLAIMKKHPEKFGIDGSFTQEPKEFNTNMYFTKAEFATFIKDVYEVGGVVNLPHPRKDSNDYYSNELEDFIFEVQDAAGKQIIYGFHVITSSLGSLKSGGSRNNYPAWESLLNQGYRIYASAGSDTHNDLDAKAITSIYATTCKEGCDGSCKNDNCAAYDKGNMISQLSCGDYVAGSVGIKMCIGDTAMGGSRTFIEGDRLVISIGDVHTGYRDDATLSENLRIDVINENGIVYSQKVVTNDTIALNVDSDSDYYRVVIYNVDRSFLIAIGNPIWNDADLN